MYYQEVKELFEKAKDKEKGKPVANNTRIVKTEKGFGLKLHDTIIVEYFPDGSFKLNSGGWQTVTTKSRINEFTPSWIKLNQENKIWYVNDELFKDGMIL